MTTFSVLVSEPTVREICRNKMHTSMSYKIHEYMSHTQAHVNILYSGKFPRGRDFHNPTPAHKKFLPVKIFYAKNFFADELRKPSTLSSSCGSNNVTEHFCHRNIEQTAEIFSCDLQSTCLSSLHATANGSSELVYSHDITFCCHVTMLEVSMTTLINPT